MVAILTCYGLNSYSNDAVNPFIVEFPAGSTNEMTTISDIDPLNDDQIPHLNFYYSYSKPVSLVPFLKDFFFIPKSTTSIWQPPQL